jgi:transformation/transcription domain-associated protein
MLHVVFDWEQQAVAPKDADESVAGTSNSMWLTPLPFRENMVSYLVRLATLVNVDPAAKAQFVPRTLALIQKMVGPGGWQDVTVGLRFFSKVLEVILVLFMAMNPINF